MWFIGVEVEQEMSAPSPRKNPGSAPADTGFQVLDSSLCQWNLDSQFQLLVRVRIL